MRKEIAIHINTEDVYFTPMTNPNFSGFHWLPSIPIGQPEEYLYGEITLPIYTPEKMLFSEGVCVQIPYTPKAWPMRVCIKRMQDEENFDFAINPVDGTIWFDIVAGINGGEKKPINASELIVIADGKYHLHFGRKIIENKEYLSGKIEVYAFSESDFDIKVANTQNSNLLIKCIPGNSYRYPLSGVGIIQWMSGDLAQATMAEHLMQEFAEDGVMIRNADFDNDTQTLRIDADYENLD